MVDVTTDIIIDVPADDVSRFASDPDRATEWYENIKSVQWQTPPPARPGSRIVFTARFLGKELQYTYEIIQLDKSTMVMRTAEGPFPMETTYEWKSVGSGKTHMFLRNRGEPTGFSKVLTPIMSMMMRKANRKDLRRLKWILENNRGPGPAVE